MKATMRNGRKRNGGQTYNSNHNTMECVRAKQPHIDQERMRMNYYFKFDEKHNVQTIKGGQGGFDSKKHEKKIYEKLYAEGLEARNQRYIKNRNKKRCREIKDLYADKKTAPLETIFQVGRLSTEMDPKERGSILLRAWRDYTKELMEQFGDYVKMLDSSYHADEQVPHLHSRMTLCAPDEHGYIMPNQGKALELMGFKRPDQAKKQDRHNNPLVAFTNHCRERFYYHCERYGIEIDREVTSHSRRQYEMEQYRMDQMKQENAKAQAELETTREKLKKEEELLTISRKKNVRVREYGTLEPEPEKRSLSGKVKEEAKPHRTIVATEDLEELQRQATYNRVQEYKIKTVEQMERAMSQDQEVQALQQTIVNLERERNQSNIDERKANEKAIKLESFIRSEGLMEEYEQQQIELSQEHSHHHKRG